MFCTNTNNGKFISSAFKGIGKNSLKSWILDKIKTKNKLFKSFRLKFGDKSIEDRMAFVKYEESRSQIKPLELWCVVKLYYVDIQNMIEWNLEKTLMTDMF